LPEIARGTKHYLIDDTTKKKKNIHAVMIDKETKRLDDGIEEDVRSVGPVRLSHCIPICLV